MGLTNVSSTMFLALFARCFGVVVCMPWGDSAGMLSKTLLAFGIALLVSPAVSVQPTVSLWCFAVEFVIGVVLAAPLRLLLDLSEALGELIDVARGQMVAAAVDPLNGHSISDLATISRLAALALALQCGALDLLLLSLAKSFQVLPVGVLRDPAPLSGEFVRGCLQMIGGIMGAAMVWFVAFLLVELTCALCARAYRGLSWSSLGGILRWLVTCTLLGVLIMAYRSQAAYFPQGSIQITLRWIGYMYHQFDPFIPKASLKR